MQAVGGSPPLRRRDKGRMMTRQRIMPSLIIASSGCLLGAVKNLAAVLADQQTCYDDVCHGIRREADLVAQ